LALLKWKSTSKKLQSFQLRDSLLLCTLLFSLLMHFSTRVSITYTARESEQTQRDSNLFLEKGGHGRPGASPFSTVEEGGLLLVNKCCYGATVLPRQRFSFVACGLVGVLDEPYSAKPAQAYSSHTGPPGYIGCTQFQPMLTGGPLRLLH
jgi:hypothetical protein